MYLYLIIIKILIKILLKVGLRFIFQSNKKTLEENEIDQGNAKSV